MTRTRYGARRAHDVEQFHFVDLTGGKHAPRLPQRHARTREFTVHIAIEHRTTRQHDRWKIHRCRRHDAGRRSLVAARREHHSIERIPAQHLNDSEVSEIAIERSGWTPAALLNGMHRKL